VCKNSFEKKRTIRRGIVKHQAALFIPSYLLNIPSPLSLCSSKSGV
jgi:hypothetical protein